MLEQKVACQNGGGYGNKGEAIMGYAVRGNNPSGSLDSQLEGNLINGNLVSRDFIQVQNELEASLLDSYSAGGISRQEVVAVRQSNRIFMSYFLERTSEDKLIYNGISDALAALRSQDKKKYNELIETLFVANMMYTQLYGIGPHAQSAQERQVYRIDIRKIMLLGILRSQLGAVASISSKTRETAVQVLQESEKKLPKEKAMKVFDQVFEELSVVADAAVKAVRDYIGFDVFTKYQLFTAADLGYSELMQQILKRRENRLNPTLTEENMEDILRMMN